MAAATIPERAHIGVTQHIDSDVFVQLADPAAGDPLRSALAGDLLSGRVSRLRRAIHLQPLWD